MKVNPLTVNPILITSFIEQTNIFKTNKILLGNTGRKVRVKGLQRGVDKVQKCNKRQREDWRGSAVPSGQTNGRLSECLTARGHVAKSCRWCLVNLFDQIIPLVDWSPVNPEILWVKLKNTITFISKMTAVGSENACRDTSTLNRQFKASALARHYRGELLTRRRRWRPQCAHATTPPDEDALNKRPKNVL